MSKNSRLDLIIDIYIKVRNMKFLVVGTGVLGRNIGHACSPD